MPDQARARTRRLWAWFALNLVVFIACYLNYRLQLKHRYLFRTLGVGLCLSRAAAMVINFNLLLVWLPMCKYTLTRLAVLANRSASRHKTRLAQLMPAYSSTSNSAPEEPLEIILEQSRHPDNKPNKPSPSSLLSGLASKLKRSFGDAIWCVRYAFCLLKIKFMGNFLIAVDHCTSLHTICATTITIASVVHTVAHLMNVINFSNKFDPLLGDLNMAQYRGQNPFQLIVSVPGITGCCMVLILFLMSLSSISIIRNSSHDLFQVFHRLSVLFVILLILHPSSHVLKEQSNVSRHQPDLCYDRMRELFNGRSNVSAGKVDSLRTEVDKAERSQSSRSGSVERNESTSEDIELRLVISARNTNESTDDFLNSEANHHGTNESRDLKSGVEREILDQDNLANGKAEGASEVEIEDSLALDMPCIDLRPSFVAQSSICWYVVGAGLSCYLLDLLLRRLRRSRGPIRLLDTRTDSEGNLIELVLSNNHRRFLHWLPGQFVYLNCPQIAAYEWHPFTISSMDNHRREFTLHIKTSGDWTRKLRYELELRKAYQNLQRPAPEGYTEEKEKSMSLFCERQREVIGSHCCTPNSVKTIPGFRSMSGFKRNSHPTGQSLSRQDYSKIVNVVANIENIDHTTGQLQVECKRLVSLTHQKSGQSLDVDQRQERMKNADDCLKIDLDQVQRGQQLSSLYPLNNDTHAGALMSLTGPSFPSIDLFIDGPFHSPFERLLEQKVSVCIASGVGWTAFSSIFQQINDNMIKSDASHDTWWWRWRNFRPTSKNFTRKRGNSFVLTESSFQTRLHIVVIVTTIDQFKPFYNIVRRYFELPSRLAINGTSEAILADPVHEVTAFITRSTRRDSDVVEFCRKENLSLANEKTFDSNSNHEPDTLRINRAFLVRFGRPEFGSYLGNFSNLYANERKISVYCCGPHQVKRAVEGICKNLNRSRNTNRLVPNFQYHEENF